MGSYHCGPATSRAARRQLIVAAVSSLLWLTIACSAGSPAPATTSPSAGSNSPAATPKATGTSDIDYAALETSIEESISSGSVALDNVRAVLVVVDGQTKIAHYRHGFTAADHAHIFSVTKSVVSTLLGIAVAEGLIPSLDAPLATLLPDHRKDMTAAVAEVTLRGLLTMSGGFVPYPSDATERIIATGRLDLVDWAVSKGQQTPAGIHFLYSDVSAHLAAAVLLSALQHHQPTKGQTVLDFARAKLFAPLGIKTEPAYEDVPITDTREFDRAGFGWIRVGDLHLGGFGLRLTADDMAKIGQLYLDDGVWHGTRLLPPGWVRQATSPSATEQAYGLFWWRDNQWGRSLYAAEGFGGQRIVVVPDRRVVVVTLATASDTAMNNEGIDPLLNDVILRALQ